jgi:hypothetical protein
MAKREHKIDPFPTYMLSSKILLKSLKTVDRHFSEVMVTFGDFNPVPGSITNGSSISTILPPI